MERTPMTAGNIPNAFEACFGEHLHVDLCLAIEMPADTRGRAYNSELLRGAMLLENASTNSLHEFHENEVERNRLEVKIDLMLALLAVTLATNRPHGGKEVNCRLSAQGLIWPYPELLSQRTQIELGLYLHPRIPLPLCLTCMVRNAVSIEDTHWHHVEFLFRDAEVKRDLERWVFLQHRRQIAARQTHASGL